MKEGYKAGFMDLNFKFYFEPEEGINTPEDFTNEIFAWAKREQKELVILEESMEPKIKIDGKTYVCKLGDPGIASQKNTVWKAMGFQGINHSIGKYLGYKWVYVYEI